MAENILGSQKIKNILQKSGLDIKNVSFLTLEYLAYEENLSLESISDLFKVSKEIVLEMFNKFDLTYDDYLARTQFNCEN